MSGARRYVSTFPYTSDTLNNVAYIRVKHRGAPKLIAFALCLTRPHFGTDPYGKALLLALMSVLT